MRYIRAMNGEEFDLNLIRALDALLREGGVSRAAVRLGLSQPAMSHALRRLRAALGDPLLVRVGGRMELTARALSLREPVSQALAGARRLLEPLDFDPATSQRRFLVMMPDLVASLIAPALTERVTREAPNVCVEISPWRSAALMTDEFVRSVDAIVTNRADAFPGFRRQTLYRDSDVVVVRRRHPDGARLKRREVFLGARHVAVVGRGEVGDQVDDWLASLGVRRKTVLVASSYLQALHIVAATDLVGFMPTRLVTSLVGTLELKAVKPPFDPGIDEQYLFYPGSAQHDPGALWFRSVLLDIGKRQTA
jgi:DNA-binding transcriptional LysR family regulator